MTGDVGAPELARRVHVTVAAIRYHCRDPRGRLYGRARKVGRDWVIPAAAAEEFAARYPRTPKRAGAGSSDTPCQTIRADAQRSGNPGPAHPKESK